MLGGTWGGLQSNLWLKAGAAVISDQVAQDFIQLGLENLQGRRLDSPSHWLSVLVGREYILYSVWNSCFTSRPLPFVFQAGCEHPGSLSVALSLGAALTSPQSCLSSGLSQPRLLSLLSRGRFPRPVPLSRLAWPAGTGEVWCGACPMLPAASKETEATEKKKTDLLES